MTDKTTDNIPIEISQPDIWRLSASTGIKLQVIEEIRRLARQHQVQRVVLFGSRARGDHWERSDIDLAAFGGDEGGFGLDVDEETSTLLKFDVVGMNGAVSEELKANIEKDGVILYEEV